MVILGNEGLYLMCVWQTFFLAATILLLQSANLISHQKALSSFTLDVLLQALKLSNLTKTSLSVLFSRYQSLTSFSGRPLLSLDVQFYSLSYQRCQGLLTKTSTHQYVLLNLHLLALKLIVKYFSI